MRPLHAAAPLVLPLALALAVPAAERTLRADLVNEKGETIGSAVAVGAPGGVLLTLRAGGLPPGRHGLHVHGVGRCEPPFQTAGGHLNPFEREHGLLNPAGPHAGDLPNVTVGRDGALEVEIFAPLLALGAEGAGARAALLDTDGSAVVLHAGADDHLTDPAGQAGGRIACAALTR